MQDIPSGAIGVFTVMDKFRTGLQQIMAGTRNFRISTISRRDVMALTEEAASISGIDYVMRARYDEALNHLLD